MIEIRGYTIEQGTTLHERNPLVFWCWNVWYQMFEYSRHKTKV